MELIASSGVHRRGLIFSGPLLSMLVIGRRLGRVSLPGTPNERPQHGGQGVTTWQSRFISFYEKKKKKATASQGAALITCAQRFSQQSTPAEYSNGNGNGKGNGKDSALEYLEVEQERKREALLQQQQDLEVPTASPGILGIPSSLLEVLPPDLLQGTEEWLDLRKSRMTASSFGNSLGFWGIRRAELWEEKIGIKEPFAGNSATRWGSSAEAAAIEKYKEITGNSVEHIAFRIYGAGDEYLSWLGASPDGLITYNAEGEQDTDERLGILEVKCPHNRGKPELGSPWDAVPYYYMPQAQGLLEIFDRKHMDFYVWTMNGSSVFRIERNREYWGLMFRIMAEFWWGHVIPAKRALKQGKSMADVEAFRPVGDPPSADRLISMSRHLAQKSRLIWRENMGHIQRF